MNRDMPSITASTYASSIVNLNALAGQGLVQLQPFEAAGIGGAAQRRIPAIPAANFVLNNQLKEAVSMTARRLVQVFIADPNENIPLEQSLLYSGEQKLTDATDQELFFEIDIKGILDKHNEKRVKIADKKIKERTEYLEPAKIRDLKMVVVNVASFQ